MILIKNCLKLSKVNQKKLVNLLNQVFQNQKSKFKEIRQQSSQKDLS